MLLCISLLFTVIYVNFSRLTYLASESDGMMIVTVEADGFSIWPYSVEINPMENLPVGAPGRNDKPLVYDFSSYINVYLNRQCPG